MDFLFLYVRRVEYCICYDTLLQLLNNNNGMLDDLYGNREKIRERERDRQRERDASSLEESTRIHKLNP